MSQSTFTRVNRNKRPGQTRPPLRPKPSGAAPWEPKPEPACGVPSDVKESIGRGESLRIEWKWVLPPKPPVEVAVAIPERSADKIEEGEAEEQQGKPEGDADPEEEGRQRRAAPSPTYARMTESQTQCQASATHAANASTWVLIHSPHPTMACGPSIHPPRSLHNSSASADRIHGSVASHINDRTTRGTTRIVLLSKFFPPRRLHSDIGTDAQLRLCCTRAASERGAVARLPQAGPGRGGTESTSRRGPPQADDRAARSAQTARSMHSQERRDGSADSTRRWSRVAPRDDACSAAVLNGEAALDGAAQYGEAGDVTRVERGGM
ncbi:hypothetical protein B0H12DRAFT_1072246 [Mycena haematopus]|nr:hypothetical protein B0H12DRAFT_1072246 [Mycena haematopus]